MSSPKLNINGEELEFSSLAALEVRVPSKTNNDKDDSSALVKIDRSTSQKLTDILHTSVQKSHGSIDTLAVIEECYGEDAAIFADSKEEGKILLAGLLDAALQKIDGDVKEEADRLVQEEASSKLNHLDEAVAFVNRKEQMAKEAEEFDRQSAQDAMRMSKLPDGITINDIMSYQAYLIKKEARDSLVSQIKSAKESCDALTEKLDKRKEVVQTKIKKLEDISNDLGKAADSCSFNGVS